MTEIFHRHTCQQELILFHDQLHLHNDLQIKVIEKDDNRNEMGQHRDKKVSKIHLEVHFLKNKIKKMMIKPKSV